MNIEKLEKFCKTLEVNDIVIANYNKSHPKYKGNVQREIIFLVTKLDEDFRYIETMCLMDSDGDSNHSQIGKKITISQFQTYAWSFKKLEINKRKIN